MQLPGFLLVLFQILTAEEVQFEVRLAASLYFKNSIKNRWDGSRSPEIVEEERSQIRDNIIEAIIRVPRKVWTVFVCGVVAVGVGGDYGVVVRGAVGR